MKTKNMTMKNTWCGDDDNGDSDGDGGGDDDGDGNGDDRHLNTARW